jgi:four helix bundle protein
MHSIIGDIDHSAVVLDHWDRAAESIIENIANGNSRRSRADRNQYFDVAIGSALECAACLDICCCRKLITKNQMVDGKRMIQPIVTMTIGLRQAETPYVKENRASYSSEMAENFFAHEALEAYKVSMELIAWFHGFQETTELNFSYARRLDKGTTSLVLNIAEGNGRFSGADQVRFLDIAHTSAMRVAACLDLLVARKQVDERLIHEGKVILARGVPLVLGLRGRLDRAKSEVT